MSMYEKIRFRKPMSLVLLTIAIWGLVYEWKGEPNNKIVTSYFKKVKNLHHLHISLPSLTRPLKNFFTFSMQKGSVLEYTLLS